MKGVKSSLMAHGTHNSHSVPTECAPRPQFLSHPSCSHNPHTSGISIGDNSGNLCDRRRENMTHNPPHSVYNKLSLTHITTDPNLRSPLQIGALLPSRCVDVKKTVGQIPGLSDVYKCSSGYWITAIHHAISCSFRSFTSIPTHLIPYKHPNYIKPPTNPPTTRSPA